MTGQPVLLHDVHDFYPPEEGMWIDDCDECWDRLLGHDDDDLKVVVKAERGRVCIPLADLRVIVRRVTLDEFIVDSRLGHIREVWVASDDTPVGLAR